MAIARRRESCRARSLQGIAPGPSAGNDDGRTGGSPGNYVGVPTTAARNTAATDFEPLQVLEAIEQAPRLDLRQARASAVAKLVPQLLARERGLRRSTRVEDLRTLEDRAVRQLRP